ncbi:coiled-coil domain-containing protein 125 [Nematostella vectensis]|uniref:coiled-coil domain-containing protein 125 n=1 Tax=Nematostella vectensis TaxID=45351 RepID=UPI0020777EE5|nr:coiled-coil domain-containing protein 125 [Nematostella vectensis]
MEGEDVVVSDDLDSCDLGLGQGLKPGGLPKLSPVSPRKSLSLPSSPGSPVTTVLEDYSTGKEQIEQLFEDSGHWNLAKLFRKLAPNILRGESKDILFGCATTGDHCQGSCGKCQNSLPRTKHRTRRNSDTILDEKNAKNKESLQRSKSLKAKPWNYFQDEDYRSLQMKLQKAKEEIETLNSDLEHCQEALQYKYGTIKSIHIQSRLEKACSREMTRKALEASKKLEQEVNMLQWELELKQSYLLDSEQTWAERFDRVATENAALLVALHARSDELRKLAIEKMALIRERDELAAALEVKDRIQGEACTPDDDGPCSSEEMIVELATLGACQCRGHKQEPCGCARAAVDAKREFGRIKKQLESARRNEEDALLSADAYRVAFEQQLTRNSSLIHELLHKSVHLPWKRKLQLTSHQTSDTGTEEDFLQRMRDRNDELVQKLVDMLSDKSEALAHQKVATKMLASKIREQEKQLKRFQTQEIEDLTTTSTQPYGTEPAINV